MAKEKNYNPVQEAKKAEKQKQIKKQKANLQAQRNEKLARRNPTRIQRDIDSLKEHEQDLRPHERQRLAELEKDLAAVNKARTALGDKAPQFKPAWDDGDSNRGGRGGRGDRGGGRGRGAVLGKRTRRGDRGSDGDASSDTDPDVRGIPMPRDTPPPMPRRRGRQSHAEEPAAPAPTSKKVYEAAPQVRDLRKEATKFMPTAVAQKMKLAKGEGKLLEPEEYDQLQKEGYMGAKKHEQTGEEDDMDVFLRAQDGAGIAITAGKAATAAVHESDYITADDAGYKPLDAGMQSAVRENTLRHVEMEEVEDEDL